MADQAVVASETTLAYDVFRPIWGLAVLAATAYVLPSRPEGAFLSDYVAAHRAQLDGVLGAVQAAGDFSADTMAIVEAQGGWSVGRVRTADEAGADLLMFSGFLESYPVPMDDPDLVRRLVAAGIDLQLADLTGALVSAAMVRSSDVEAAAALVVEAVGGAAAFAGADAAAAAAVAFRAWRVGSLPAVLRPDSKATENARRLLRAYVRELEKRLLA